MGRVHIKVARLSHLDPTQYAVHTSHGRDIRVDQGGQVANGDGGVVDDADPAVLCIQLGDVRRCVVLIDDGHAGRWDLVERQAGVGRELVVEEARAAVDQALVEVGISLAWHGASGWWATLLSFKVRSSSSSCSGPCSECDTASKSCD
jgi:hypothetical protein